MIACCKYYLEYEDENDEGDNNSSFDCGVMEAAMGALYYKQNRSIDGVIEYLNSNFIMHREAELEDGLLGYTDTQSFVYVTTANRYGHSKQEILYHEHLHIMHPDWSEYEIRRTAELNTSIDIELQMWAVDRLKEGKNYLPPSRRNFVH